MNRNTLFALTLTLFAAPALAGPGGHDRTPNFERLATKLELSDAQASEFTRIMAEQHELRQTQMQALRAQRESEGKSDALREQFKAAREQGRLDTHNALSGVLTTEQLDKLDAMMERRGKGKRNRRNDRDDSEQL